MKKICRYIFGIMMFFIAGQTFGQIVILSGTEKGFHEAFVAAFKNNVRSTDPSLFR